MSTVPAMPPWSASRFRTICCMRWSTARLWRKRWDRSRQGLRRFFLRSSGPFARANRLGQVFTEMLFRINFANDLQRRPDVAFVSHARWPFNRRPPRGPVWDMVPDLAIEVISESNSAL